MKACHIICKGVVQGVGFRYFTKLEAEKYGLTGRVKNLPNGTVEIYIKGIEAELHKFLEWCHVGPKTGQVDYLEYEFIDPTAIINSDFIIDRN